MALIRTPVIPMVTPTTEKLVEGEIVNINDGESLGIIKSGRVFDLMQDMTDRMLKDESVAMQSDIDSENSIGYFDKNGEVLMYKVYGATIDMNNSDCLGNVTPYTEFSKDIDINDFIDNFLGFKKENDRYGRTVYKMNRFYYSYSILYNKMAFIVCAGDSQDLYDSFDGKVAIFRSDASDEYDSKYSYKFTYKHLTLIQSIVWLLCKSTDMDHNLELLKSYNMDFYTFYKMLTNDSWVYDTANMDRSVVEGYISHYEILDDMIYPSAYEASSNSHFCTKFKCTNKNNHMVYVWNNELNIIDNENIKKHRIEVTFG